MKNVNEIYYSPKYNRFIQIRGLRDDGYIVGRFTTFFNDACKVIGNSQVSRDFCKDFIEVRNIDEFKFSKLSKITNTWRVK